MQKELSEGFHTIVLAILIIAIIINTGISAYNAYYNDGIFFGSTCYSYRGIEQY